MDNAYPRMVSMERDDEHVRIYKALLFEAIKEVSSMYKTLNNSKLKFDFCLNHLTKPTITVKQLHQTLGLSGRNGQV